MKTGSFEQEVFIEADAAIVMDAISDYSQQQLFHPLIVKVVQATIVPAGILRRYVITDRLCWGPFSVKINYRADILSVTADTVHTEVHQFPGIHILLISTVKRVRNGVALRETFTLKAPNILFNYAFRQAEMAHAETLDRLKGYIEGVMTR
jgi:hypothetical protein